MNETIRPIKRIPRERLAEIDDKLRRHDIATMKLLAEKHPEKFREIAREIEVGKQISLDTPKYLA